jgi:hypothetical protein
MYDDETDPNDEPQLNAEVSAAPAQIEQLPDPDPDPEEDEPDARPKKLSRGLQERFGELTSRISAERAARAHAERRAMAAESLIQRMGPGAGRQGASVSAPPPRDLERMVEARAQQIVAAHAFTAKSNAIHQAGVQAYPDFQDRINELQAHGVLSPQRPGFLAALMQSDHPEKVLHHLGGDPEAARQIAGMPPLKQAAELAKLSVRIGQQGHRPVSQAPAPISPIGGASARGFNPSDDSVPIDQWMREMDKRDSARRARRG